MAYHHDLARMAVACSLRDIGSETRKALELTIIDTLGCAAASAPEDFAIAAERSQLATTGSGACSVIGRAQRLTPSGAAFMNATLGHGYDFDDVHLPSVAHFSTIVIPAAMAACELFDADGRTFLEAVMTGDEVGGRIGWAACSTEWNGTAVRNRGFFPTAILGTIAAAAAVAKVARLDEASFAQAIAIACSYAGGLAAISRGDNSTKRTQAGWAAQAGLAAALLAKEGFTGPDAVLETNQGFFEAFTGNHFRPEALQRTADMPWVCEEMSFKWYPLEYIIHPLVEMTHRARADVLPRLADVTRIEASATSRFVTLFTPKATKTAPADPFMALMSAPYCIARALLKPGTGHLFLPDFREDYVFDEATRSLASKVDFTTDPSFEAVFPQHVAGALRFFAGDELLWQGRVDDAYGSLHRPMSRADLTGKFETNCAQLGRGYAATALETLEGLDSRPDARWIGRLRAGDL
ncbi:putative 2-methylcitrate dehydratase [Burkholderiales bacterium 8X]|nr:putative 2-methylcitrate dehydratase [Burkholderiales bacterium 8X]